MTKAQIKTLDKLWSLAVRSIGYCEHCGRTSPLDAHHIIGRTKRAVRWNPLNGVCLCKKCHWWAHGDPVAFVHWLDEAKGSRVIDALRLEAQMDVGTVKRVDFDAVKGSLA